MKILIGINTLTSVEQQVYANHCQFWYRLGRSTKHEFIFFAPRRMSIDNMRNTAAKVAIENDCDYLLFIDDDILVQVGTLESLIDCEADVAAAWTKIRGYPFKNMAFRWVDKANGAMRNVDDDELTYSREPMDAVGFACCLISVPHLKKISKPWFITGPYNTEDIYFCVKSQKEVPGCKIVLDTDIITQHQLEPEFVSTHNLAALKLYQETVNGAKDEPGVPDTQQQHDDKIGDKSLPTYESIMGEIFS